MLLDTGTFLIVLAAAVAVIGLFVWFKYRTSEDKAR